jgi:hypothetical protein
LHPTGLAVINRYREEIENELSKICEDIFNILDLDPDAMNPLVHIEMLIDCKFHFVPQYSHSLVVWPVGFKCDEAM